MAYIKSSTQALWYSKFRPSPPEKLIEKIVSFVKENVENPRGVALDVGCGSGQSTEILSPYFHKVVGIDTSEEQLQLAKNNTKHTNVLYRKGTAERLGEADGSVDLVTAGMAVHWFDINKFYTEVGRVLRPKGVLAIYGYHLPQPVLNGNSLAHPYRLIVEHALGQYIPKGSRLAYFDGYKGEQFSKFPFSNEAFLRHEFLYTNKDANIGDLVGYISSMSAYHNYCEENGEEKAKVLLDDVKSQIVALLEKNTNKDMQGVLDFIFPFVLLLGRKDF